MNPDDSNYLACGFKIGSIALHMLSVPWKFVWRVTSACSENGTVEALCYMYEKGNNNITIFYITFESCLVIAFGFHPALRIFMASQIKISELEESEYFISHKPYNHY